jgi:hypothetical protein
MALSRFVVQCVRDLLGISIAAFLLERPAFHFRRSASV